MPLPISLMSLANGDCGPLLTLTVCPSFIFAKTDGEFAARRKLICALVQFEATLLPWDLEDHYQMI